MIFKIKHTKKPDKFHLVGTLTGPRDYTNVYEIYATGKYIGAEPLFHLHKKSDTPYPISPQHPYRNYTAQEINSDLVLGKGFDIHLIENNNEIQN